MLSILGKLPYECVLATSGGIDSMFAFHFLTQHKYRERTVHIAFFDHGTETSRLAKQFLLKQFKTVTVGTCQKKPESNKEAIWRIERYKFLESFKLPVITAHHLDDCVETYLFSAFNGTPKVIQYSRNNIIRPFLLITKKEIREYVDRYGIKWIEDETNADVTYSRNRIRHNILPEVLKVNPGIHKVVKRFVINNFNKENEFSELA